eukprot:m.228253 g.228253  ORF g.228253 m.228253 type:complete len:361 (+) comp15190_c0_seq1:82-1164(+)
MIRPCTTTSQFQVTNTMEALTPQDTTLQDISTQATDHVDIDALPEEQPPATFQGEGGEITYVVQGSVLDEDGTPKPALVTFPDIGLDYRACFQSLLTFPASKQLLKSFVIVHLHAPGQHANAADLPADFVFPSPQQLAVQATQVLLHLGIDSWVGIGAGAGGNILLRCALLDTPNLYLNGLMLIGSNFRSLGWWEWFGYKIAQFQLSRGGDMSAYCQDMLLDHYFSQLTQEADLDKIDALKTHFATRVNTANLARYMQEMIWRDDLVSRATRDTIKTHMLLVAGSASTHLEQIELLNSQLNPSKTNYVKVNGGGNLVSEEYPAQILQAFVLFIQGLGFGSEIVVQMRDLSCEQLDPKHVR